MSDRPSAEPPPIAPTPIATRRPPLVRALSALALRLAGWKVEGEVPPYSRFVVIGAPHTSNWDWALMVAVTGYLGIKPYWMGKRALFPGPLAPLMRWLGGIPIDRDSPKDVVEQVVDAFKSHHEMVVIITPEGTRKRAPRWKTGFYRIARAAGVPIVLAWIDYPSRRVGIGPAMTPTGDLEADLRLIGEFYRDKRGLYPDQGGPPLPDHAVSPSDS